jgi:hypothetical protein
MQVHTHAHTRHAHTTHTNSTKKLRVKEGNQFKSSFFGAGVVVSAKHISSTPKGECSSTVELQIGGVAAPELVWWSRSPPKHALSVASNHFRPVTVFLLQTICPRKNVTPVYLDFQFICSLRLIKSAILAFKKIPQTMQFRK